MFCKGSEGSEAPAHVNNVKLKISQYIYTCGSLGLDFAVSGRKFILSAKSSRQGKMFSLSVSPTLPPTPGRVPPPRSSLSQRSERRLEGPLQQNLLSGPRVLRLVCQHQTPPDLLPGAALGGCLSAPVHCDHCPDGLVSHCR